METVITAHQAIIIGNIMATIYIISNLVKQYRLKDNITQVSQDHIISHAYIVGLILVTVNIAYLLKYVTPLLIAIIFLLIHFYKEDKAMAQYDDWNEL